MIEESPGLPTSPRVFVSYSHDSPQHKGAVLDLAQELRSNGIDALIDQFIENDPPLSWPLWMSREIRDADFVLTVFTEIYSRRFDGREEPGRGLGARWEGAIITGEMYQAQDEKVKFIPVVFRADDAAFIPIPLRLTTFYEVGAASRDNSEALLRHLLGKPKVEARPIGTTPSFTVAEGTSDGGGSIIRRARELAESGEPEQAEELLLPLLNAPPDAAARAALMMGTIRHKEERYADAVIALERAIDLATDDRVRAQAVEELQLVLHVMNSHYGEGSAVESAEDYIAVVQSGDMEELWRRTDPNLRLVLSQAWIFANETHPRLIGIERDAAARDLASLTVDHDLKPDFFATQINEFQGSFRNFDPQIWGAAERPRRFGIDHELVIFMDTGGEVMIFKGGMSPPAIALLMKRSGGGWQTANVSAAYPVPGWPPSHTPLPNLDVRFINPDDTGSPGDAL